MPEIKKYICSYCVYSFPTGWGGYMYVEDEKGKRIPYPHPSEFSKVREVLGCFPTKELLNDRTCFNSYCICLDCKNRYEADLGDETHNKWRSY